MLKTIMKKDLYRNKKGFTLAEVMMAVAIMAILAGVSFIGVISYRRSMTLLERDGIAKEIYVAAQNHLTMLEGQGYPGKLKTGKEEEIEKNGKKEKTYYFAVNKGTVIPDDCSFDNSMLGQMLPFGAVDETVRIGGNYIIHYQLNPALVLDVCYSESGSGDQYSHTFTASECNSGFMVLMKNNRGARLKYSEDDSVIGYYGAEEATSLETIKLKTPTIKVINAERLIVEVTNPNEPTGSNEDVVDHSLQLLVKGVTSGATNPTEKIFQLRLESEAPGSVSDGYFSQDDSGEYTKYTIVLDDVTEAGKHFYDLFKDDGFYPGEDITIQAIAYSNKKLANVAKSVEQTTNSLFAEIDTEEGGTVQNTALIENIRHLENLDQYVSRVRDTGNDLAITRAEQISDLSWPEYKKTINSDSPDSVSVFRAYSELPGTGGFYYPVSPRTAINYEGNNYRIEGVAVNSSEIVNDDVGLFGVLPAGSEVKNIELIDFSIETQASGKNAGALAGSATTTTVTNVIAYCSDKGKYEGADKVVSESGSAGGLIGSMSGGTVSECAASIHVVSKGENAGGNAGGLVGTISTSGDDKGTISACYSGGHTDGTTGDYLHTQAGSNVEGSNRVGGLVGDAGTATIKNSYSTCSAYGTTDASVVGGFVGYAGRGSIENCYSTGYVSGGVEPVQDIKTNLASKDQSVLVLANIGAFAGKLDSTTIDTTNNSSCKYFEIVNEREIKDGSSVIGYAYLASVGGVSSSDGKTTGITALDESASTYNDFCEVDTSWTVAEPYDDALKRYYYKTVGEEPDVETIYLYNLKGISRLTTLDADSYVYVHYGDWPAPEIFVINTTS